MFFDYNKETKKYTTRHKNVFKHFNNKKDCIEFAYSNYCVPFFNNNKILEK